MAIELIRLSSPGRLLLLFWFFGGSPIGFLLKSKSFIGIFFCDFDVEGSGGISAAKSLRIFFVTSSSSKSVDGSYGDSNMFLPAFSSAELLFFRLVRLFGRSLDLEFLESLDRFSQLSCILKSPLNKKFIVLFE